MLCTKCGQRQATTIVYRNYNGHTERMYICDECKKSLITPDFSGFDAFNEAFDRPPMGLVKSINDMFGAPVKRVSVCPDCKTTDEEFLSGGFAGCPRCYTVFEPLVVRTVQTLQQADRHIGKRPSNMRRADTDDAARLRAELDAAIKSEDYIRAVELSSALAKLNGEGSGGV